ncbi:MAG: alpha-amylase C-terminal beta-sheet domain-containing protein [Gemmataceae bacterium]
MHPRTHWRAWRNPAAPTTTAGDGHDVLLQGFHWDSWRGNCDKKNRKSWYQVIKDNAEAIRQAGFTWVWFPPVSDSLAPQGYIPRRWDVLDSAYGSEAELRAALAALAPVRAMADVVLNHRVGVATSGADFADPPFPDNRAAIVRDDESGVGTGNPDTGERHPAGRDLDHTNPDVRATIKRYLGRLKEVGFAGWRYDLCKGFAGQFVGEYNDASSPALSVGEVFETDRQKVTDWIDSTGGKSSAFDFPTRYLLYDACTRDDYAALRSQKYGQGIPGGLIGYWPARAVTFVDNHDTESRREREHQANYDSTRHFHGATVEMAYAYTLTHPGVPCVFWAHYFDWGAQARETIGRLIRARRMTGVHSESPVRITAAEGGLYAAVIDDRLAVRLGGRDWTPPGRGWQMIASGERFAVWADE